MCPNALCCAILFIALFYCVVVCWPLAYCTELHYTSLCRAMFDLGHSFVHTHTLVNDVMSYYVMSCYAMLCYVMRCNVRCCDAIWSENGWSLLSLITLRCDVSDDLGRWLLVWCEIRGRSGMSVGHYEEVVSWCCCQRNCRARLAILSYFASLFELTHKELMWVGVAELLLGPAAKNSTIIPIIITIITIIIATNPSVVVYSSFHQHKYFTLYATKGLWIPLLPIEDSVWVFVFISVLLSYY